MNSLRLLLLTGWLMGQLTGFSAWSAPTPGTNRATVAAPASFSLPNGVTFDFRGSNALKHWRFRGNWSIQTLNNLPIVGSILALDLRSTTTSATPGSFAASPGIYLSGGTTYTLSYRRDSETLTTPYTIGYSPVQDGTTVTPITSFTARDAEEFTTVYTHTFTVPADGVYHLVFLQTPDGGLRNNRDRFTDISVFGTGARLAPAAEVNTHPELSRANPTIRMVSAEGANMGLQTMLVEDPLNAIGQVQYWALNTQTNTSQLVGTSASAPNYPIVWSNLPLGTYEVRTKLLDSRGIGALSSAPLNLTVEPSQFSISTYLGGAGVDDVRAMVYQPDGSLVMAVNASANPPGVTPTFLGGSNAASTGAIIRLSQNGRQVLNMVRLPGRLVDLATDGQGRLYVAAGTAGAFRLSANLSAVEWNKVYPGQFAHRIDAGPLGNVAVMIANENDPDDSGIQGNVRLLAYSPTGADLCSIGSISQYTADVAIDEASQTLIGIGHKNFSTRDPGGQSFPVFVPVIKGFGFNGVQKYTMYDWSSDNQSPRWLNRSNNNMADAKSMRGTIGKDGKLYVLFEVDGGNHVMRYDPFDIMLPVRIVGGDEYFNWNNTRAESKTFVGRYEPGTGAYLLGQTLTGRIANGSNANDRIGNTISIQTGNVAADAEGRVFIAADAAFGPPLTVDHLPGQYTGGGYAIVLSPDMARREAAFRVTRSKGRAIAAINGTTWAYGGTADRSLLYPTNATQTTFGGQTDGFFAVTGGSATPVAVPTVAITTPVNVTTTATPILTGTATPGAIVTLRGPLSTTMVPGPGNVLSLTASPSGTWSTTALTFVSGPTAVTAFASNAGGTSAPAVASFTVVGAVLPPVVDITFPVNTTANAIPVIRGTATPGAVVLLTLPTSATGGPISVTATLSGQWATSQQPYRFATGINSITAVATNAIGASVADVATFTVVSAQPVPYITISSPNNNTTTARPNVTGTASAFAVVTVRGPAASAGGPVTLTATSDGAWSTSAITFPTGVNNVTATASSPGGTASDINTFTVATAQTALPPTMVITSPVNATTIQMPVINGTVTPGATVTLTGPVSATGGPVIITATSAGVWTVSSMRFPLGVNSITATASNANGTSSPVTASFTVALPPALPAVLVDIISPKGVSIAVAAAYTIVGSATPGASVTLTGPPVSTGGPVVLTANAAGGWATTALGFPTGTHTVTAVAGNAGGTSAPVVATFNVVVPPVVSITFPVNQAVNTFVPNITGTSTANASVRITGPANSVGGPEVVTANASGVWSTSGITFLAGPNSITAVATVANVQSAPATASFTVTVPPTLTINAPGSITATASPTISGTTTPFASITISGPANSTGGPIVVFANASGNWSGSGIRFPAGSQTATVRAGNGGGITTRSTTFTVVIPATAPPSLTISSPRNVTTTATPTISGTATADAQLTLQTSAGGSVGLTINSDRSWAVSSLMFTPGPQSVTATVSNAGGTATAVTTFTVVAGTTCTSMASVKVGNWTDPTVWSCGRVPNATDPVILRHAVTVLANTQADALTITFEAGGQLRTSPQSILRLR